MNTLQDAREAQQMWEYRFNNPGREGIELRNGKPRGILMILTNSVNKITAKHVTYNRNLRDGLLKV